MYNRYQGNTGRVIRMQESGEINNSAGKDAVRGRQEPETAVRQRPPQPVTPPRRPSQPKPMPKPPLLSTSLSSLLPKGLGELDTEDLILLLILYLMYRESGDTELLMIMGAMFLA